MKYSWDFQHVSAAASPFPKQGLVVLVNAIAMGVRIDCQCGSDLLWQVLDNIFLIAFIIEFCLRAAISGIRHFGIMLLSDSWIQFDFLVVCLSIVDTWVLGGVGSGGVYTLARLYRLLKLVKMVRVLRAFRQLAMLVEGILSSLQTLFLGRAAAGHDHLHPERPSGDHVPMEPGGHHCNPPRLHHFAICHVDADPGCYLWSMGLPLPGCWWRKDII